MLVDKLGKSKYYFSLFDFRSSQKSLTFFLVPYIAFTFNFLFTKKWKLVVPRKYTVRLISAQDFMTCNSDFNCMFGCETTSIGGSNLELLK